MAEMTVRCISMGGVETLVTVSETDTWGAVCVELADKLNWDSYLVRLVDPDTAEELDTDETVQSKDFVQFVLLPVTWDVLTIFQWSAEDLSEGPMQRFAGWHFFLTGSGGPEAGFLCESRDGGYPVFRVMRTWGTPYEFEELENEQLVITEATHDSYAQAMLVPYTPSPPSPPTFMLTLYYRSSDGPQVAKILVNCDDSIDTVKTKIQVELEVDGNFELDHDGTILASGMSLKDYGIDELEVVVLRRET
jgi:hypothetical protein